MENSEVRSGKGMEFNLLRSVWLLNIATFRHNNNDSEDINSTLSLSIMLRYDPMIIADDRRGAMMDVLAVKDRHSSLNLTVSPGTEGWCRRGAPWKPRPHRRWWSVETSGSSGAWAHVDKRRKGPGRLQSRPGQTKLEDLAQSPCEAWGRNEGVEDTQIDERPPPPASFGDNKKVRVERRRVDISDRNNVRFWLQRCHLWAQG